MTDLSVIRSGSFGQGNAGNITIATGDLSLLEGSDIQAGVGGTGKGGDIKITTTGNIDLVTKDPTLKSIIVATTNGQGNSGKISISTPGDLLLSHGGIFAGIETDGVGNSLGIDIKARNINLSNSSQIGEDNIGKGNAGNIKIETSGNLNISGTDDKSLLKPDLSNLSTISTQTTGDGDSGKISIDTKGDLSIFNRAALLAGITDAGTGNSQGIKIRANNLKLSNFGRIFAGNIAAANANVGRGKGGNIEIETAGNLTISGTDDRSLL